MCNGNLFTEENDFPSSGAQTQTARSVGQRLTHSRAPFEFEAGLHHAMTGKLSVNPAVNGYLFQIREGQGSERRGLSSAFRQLCPKYSGTLTPTASTAIRVWEIFTFLTRNAAYFLAWLNLPFD